MAVLQTVPSFFPPRISQYVPAMRYFAAVNDIGDTRITFGAPMVAAATGVLAPTSIAVAGSVGASGMLKPESDLPYGRTIQVQASGAATSTVTIDGYDYLGQAMTEVLTLNGATAVQGNKAFKRARLITWGATAGTTITVGPGTRLGLPFKALKVLSEEFAQAPVATLGTLTAPFLGVATATSVDPRGLYTPTSALNGTSELTATFMFNNQVNAANEGGLHGMPHYAA